MKRAGLYVRVSTAEQRDHGISVDSQIQALREYCTDHGYSEVKFYNDAGISASKSYKYRPALLQMLDDCQNGKLDILLFTKLDRFFRSVPDYYACVQQMNNVPWRAIWEDYETETSAGKFKVNIMLSVAQAESDRTSERIKAVNRYRKETGNFVGGLAPRGYKVVRHEDRTVHLEPDPEMQETIQRFFDTYLATWSPTAALDAISDKVVINRAGAVRMLKNKTYAGDSKGYKCFAYITEQQYNMIQDSIIGRRNRETNVKHTYLFSGLLICPECGRRMVGKWHSARNRRGEKYYSAVYACNGHTTHFGCGNTAVIFESKIEKYLLSELEPLMDDKRNEIDVEYKEMDDPSDKIIKLESRLSRIGDRFELGDISKDEYIRKRTEVKEQIEFLKSRTKEKPELKKLPDNWKDIYNDLDKEHRKSFWNTIIKKITITGRHAKDRKYIVEFKY